MQCPSVPVTFAFDCLAAGYAASGTWACPVHSSLHRVTRALSQWICSRFHISIAYEHVAAHTGHPWNEAADAACWSCLNSWILGVDFEAVFPPAFFADSHAFAWLWFLEKALQQCPGFPMICRDHFVFPLPDASEPSPRPDLHIQTSSLVGSSSCHSVDTSFVMRCASANVLTLSSGATRACRFVSARHEALMKTFHDAGVHLVGIQESRSRLSGHLDTALYHVLSASATPQGHYGVQLWIAKSFVFSDQALVIKHSHIRVLAQSSRHLVVRFMPPGLRLLLVVGHVPCDGGQSAAHDWWHCLSNSVPSTYRSWPCIMLLDANARVGSLTSDAIGDHQPDDENAAGAVMHQWLVDHHMFAPQTMAAYHSGPAATFVHSRGHEGRIDYVLLSQCLKHADLRTFVSDIDLSLQRQDHRPVIAEVPVLVRVTSAKRRHVSVLRSSAPLDSPGLVPWHIDVHTHAAMLHQWLHRRQPQPLRWPRKQHLQDCTWHLIQQKSFHWKRIRQIRCAVRSGVLRCLFHGWRETVSSGSSFAAPCFLPWLKLADHTLAWHLSQHSRLVLPVLYAVRHDDRLYFQQFAARHSDESFPNLWKSLKCLLPKATSKRQSNLRCIGPASSEIAQHFNTLEAGERVSYDALLSQCHHRQQDALKDAPLVVPLSQLPTRLDFEALCARIKPNRAPGMDGVTGATLQFFFADQSEVGHQLILKAFLLGSEPLQWKGGFMHVIPKKSGSLQANMMRGIMLLTTFGKLYHATLRQLLLPWLTAARIPAQLGGFRFQQTSFATHLLRTFCNLAVHRNLSFGVVFVDVKAAFHSMLREHTFGHSSALPSRLVEVLSDAGLDVDVLSRTLVEHASFFESHPSMCLQRAIQDAHCDTWYSIRGHADLYQTHRGSRPGSPLADIAYNTAMRGVLCDVLSRLQQQPWLLAVAACLPIFPPLVTWVDDLAIPVPASSADQLDGCLVTVLSIVEDVFNSYGLQLNRQAGKTEIVCQYRGKGAPACRHRRFVEQFGRLPMASGESVRVVAKYPHLGTAFSQSLSFSAELDSRLGKASHAFRQLSKSVFRNRHLSSATRLQLLESLVLSIVMYGSGTWSLLTHRQYTKISHAIITWQRQITGDEYWRASRLSDADFLAKWKLPTFSARLAKHRLLYAFQLVSSAPQDLITCLTAEDALPDGSAWCRAVRHAVEWLALQSPASVTPAELCAPEGLFQWLHSASSYGPNLVRRCVRRAVMQDRLAFDLRKEMRSIYHACSEAGVIFADSACPVLHANHTTFPCHVCEKEFSTVQGLQAHRWKAHGITSLERLYIFDTTCRACHRCFWSVQRLQQHLRWSRRHEHGCFHILQRDYLPLAAPVSCPCPPPLRDVHRLPACPVAGPLPLPGPPAWEQQRDAEFALLSQQWHSLDLPRELPEACQTQVFDACHSVIQLWLQDVVDGSFAVDDLITLWTDLLERLNPSHDPNSIQVWAFLLWGRDCLPSIIDSIANPSLQLCIETAIEDFSQCFPLWSLLMRFDANAQRSAPVSPVLAAIEPVPDARKQHDLEPLSRSFFDPVASFQHIVRPVSSWPALPGVPVVHGFGPRPTLFILHMFSGRRRVDDCHDYIMKLASEFFPDFDVFPVSMDTAIDSFLGVLSDGPCFSLLLELADGGLFALNLTGPPCETWTAARHLKCENLHCRGPRPLRMCQTPWGVPGLTLRELTQLGMGSHLMLHSLGIELRIVLRGGGSLMEHPAWPSDPTFASIWRTDLHRDLLMKCPHALEVYIEQWRYGADCVKPTVLRGLGLPDINHFLHSCALPHAIRPTKVLAGFDESTKTFRTSAAKEYPSDLCQAMIRSTFGSLRSRIASAGTVAIDWSAFSADARGFVKQNRPNIDIEDVATGEVWFGADALEKGLVDELQTSSEYIMQQIRNGHEVLEVSYKQTAGGLGGLGLGAMANQLGEALKARDSANFPWPSWLGGQPSLGETATTLSALSALQNLSEAPSAWPKGLPEPRMEAKWDVEAVEARFDRNLPEI
eukprot:s2577_g10.t1